MPTKTKYFQNCLGVFQGGGCRGAAFVGAFQEATRRGVSFSEVVGTSAGSIVAAFIAAGATPEQLRDIITRLKFTELLGDPIRLERYKRPILGFIVRLFKRDYGRILIKLGIYDSLPLQTWDR